MTDALFELPSGVPPEDMVVIQNILIGLQSLTSFGGGNAYAADGGGSSSSSNHNNNSHTSEHDRGGGEPLCAKYKVDLTHNGYLIKGAIPHSDIFEVTENDLLYLKGINPARIESAAVARLNAAGPCEVLIRVLNGKQRVMVSSSVSYFTTVRKKQRRILKA